MALTEKEIEAIGRENQAGLSFRQLAKKYRKSFKDLKAAIAVGNTVTNLGNSPGNAPRKGLRQARGAEAARIPLGQHSD